MNCPGSPLRWHALGVRTYGQYCPIARASELLGERWSTIILRNILVGCQTFNEIAEGAPGLSRGLLSKRLQELERAGVIEIRPKPDGGRLTTGRVLRGQCVFLPREFPPPPSPGTPRREEAEAGDGKRVRFSRLPRLAPRPKSRRTHHERDGAVHGSTPSTFIYAINDMPVKFSVPVDHSVCGSA